MPGIQVNNGKAFEYACLLAIHTALSDIEDISIVESPQLFTACQFYEAMPPDVRQSMNFAATAAVRVIDRLEPQLRHPQRNTPLYLSLQSDAQGMAGDVRDVICVRRQNEWEIGISCKHNHYAVKHSRLSATIDFGQEWLGIPCSRNYFNTIGPIFNELAERRRRGEEWNDIPDKAQRFYLPILNAFTAELNSMTQTHQDVPPRLIRYLIGVYDFYKVISDDAHRITWVQGMNIYGTLNRPSGNNPSIVHVPRVRLPSLFFFIGMRPDSDNTVIVGCNEGWQLSMRIHNASTYVEPSLKFDVQLISLPHSVYSQAEPWDQFG